MKIKYNKKYDDIITFSNLLKAWKCFKIGKSGRLDVNNFELNLLDNLNILSEELKSKSYKHSGYSKFSIIEIKKREINKASVRDRIVHQLLYSEFYPYFERQFIYDSYSCRDKKGTHKALERYGVFFRKVSRNFTLPVYVLKFDIKKCFENISQEKY